MAMDIIREKVIQLQEDISPSRVRPNNTDYGEKFSWKVLEFSY